MILAAESSGVYLQKRDPVSCIPLVPSAPSARHSALSMLFTMSMPVFLSLLLFLPLLSLSQRVSSCTPSCRYSLCTPSTLSLTSLPDVPHLPLCLGSRPLLSASSGAALVLTPSPRPLAALGFAPTLFKTYLREGVAGVGHQVVQADAGTLQDMCIVLPIRQAQVRGDDGHVINLRMSKGSEMTDCVAFVVKERNMDNDANAAPRKVSVNDTIVVKKSIKLGEKLSFLLTVEARKASGVAKEDVYVLVDGTASMDNLITNGLQGRIHTLVASRQRVSDDVAFGFGYYKDDNEITPFVNLVPLSRNPSLFSAAVNSLSASSTTLNQHPAEGNLFALLQTATLSAIGWRAGARRLIVYIGDAPGHEPVCMRGSHLDRQNVTRALRAANVTLLAVSFPVGGSFSPGLDARTRPFGCPDALQGAGKGQASSIASGTGGVVKRVDRPEEVVGTVVKMIAGMRQQLSADTRECERKGVQVSFQHMPVKVAPGKSVSVMMHVVVEKAACAADKGFSCAVKFSLAGVPIGVQTLTASGIVGC